MWLHVELQIILSSKAHVVCMAEPALPSADSCPAPVQPKLAHMSVAALATSVGLPSAEAVVPAADVCPAPADPKLAHMSLPERAASVGSPSDTEVAWIALRE